MGLLYEYATALQKTYYPPPPMPSAPPSTDEPPEAAPRATLAAQPRIHIGHMMIALFLSVSGYFACMVFFMLGLVLQNPEAFVGAADLDPVMLAEAIARSDSSFFTLMLIPVTLAYLFGAMIGVAFIVGRLKNDWSAIGAQRATPPMMRYAIQSGLISGLLISGGSLLGLQAAGAMPALQQTLMRNLALMPNAALFIGILLAIVVLPLVEAFVYRGVVFSYFRRASTPFMAIGGSAFLFATFNGNLLGFLPSFFLGILLGVVFDRTQNLWASFLAHSTFNFVTLILYTLVVIFSVG